MSQSALFSAPVQTQTDRFDMATPGWSHAYVSDWEHERDIEKHDIFCYVYAVLQNPAYLKRYGHNLKREFPRIPFYDNFVQWACWGARLLDIHAHYEHADLYPLRRLETGRKRKVRLVADIAAGMIDLDGGTILTGVPAAAWDYKLGNRSALEWVLDRYKERTPRDSTIRERFDTYRFADHKAEVIGLLCKVTTVSALTVAIIAEMEKAA